MTGDDGETRPRALAPGPHRLCRLDAIPDGQARGFILPLAGEAPQPDFPEPEQRVLVVRRGPQVWAYRNICPHAHTPLDWTPDRFMSADGRHLHCATHGARFEVATGACAGGPCRGQGLTALPVRVRDAMVLVDGNAGPTD